MKEWRDYLFSAAVTEDKPLLAESGVWCFLEKLSE